MNIFDNIAKNVRKATVPAVESLTETEIDGLAMAATTNEDYDTIGAAMEAIGVETVYKEDKIKKEDLTEKEIQQLYAAGMEDEDPDDYEDPYTEEAIIDGYIEEAYAAEADDALGALSEEDLEDIEDDDATESYLLLAGSEDIAEESVDNKIIDTYRKKREDIKKRAKIIEKEIDEMDEEGKRLLKIMKSNREKLKDEDTELRAHFSYGLQLAYDELDDDYEYYRTNKNVSAKVRRDIEALMPRYKKLKNEMASLEKEELELSKREDELIEKVRATRPFVSRDKMGKAAKEDDDKYLRKLKSQQNFKKKFAESGNESFTESNINEPTEDAFDDHVAGLSSDCPNRH